ncbi:ArnT family glycosyltransferase [Maridesulfovibrio hydrothermalis]|uniref:Glycosyltransferase RgtA/B/C/D-like domain-containing protein n=1 Tax=Maridesulfovibrio hydrothermalis AM13 = DSM 14728 TaxID=1121451 RepID=L0RDL7_9BACT|nr:glycosyltransferase family 39 protein [Maridesulfovibrio hydrothermalis]CCO24295.1 conserved membrane protein of unknown function [Maridesulfovibrio hydrothermalis AM13 = DSM 14728]
MSYILDRNKVVLMVLMLAVLVFAGATAVAVKKSLSKSENSYLEAHGKARWIKQNLPFRLNARSNDSEVILFKRIFELTDPSQARLNLKAFRGSAIWLDGSPLRKFDGATSKWRDTITIDLPELKPGRHELKIAVINENGHSAMLAWSDELGISTPEGWEASRDDFVWNPAVDAAQTGKLFITDKFKRADKALFGCLPYMLPLFLFAAGFIWLRDNKKMPAPAAEFNLTPEAFRFILIGLWAVMAFNNFHALHLKFGMDSTGHFKYIQYVGDNLALPSPLDGWQMFQPPLYYMISGVFYKILSLIMDLESTLYWLRLIPLTCGAAMIEICFRSAKLVFGKDKQMQIIATLLGGFMPMNFVMSQFWGNEPFAAVFTGLSILMALTLILKQDRRNLKEFMLLGTFLGLAVLSKATASLLIPLCLFFIPLAVLAAGNGEKDQDYQTAKQVNPFLGIGLTSIVTAIVGGWYYLKNWLCYGKPFIGGWDAIREIQWWQDHGYRIWEHFITFGSSILRPVYSTTNGIWDGLYSTLWLDGNLSGISKFGSRPPWNDDLMVATALLALIPTLLILIGIARTFFTPVKSILNGRMFLAGCIAIYFTAVTYLYLNLPVYSTAKASYTLGLLPCYGILAAIGIQPLLKNLYGRAISYGFLTVWGTTIYLTYFV